MHNTDSSITIITTLMHALHEVGFVAGKAEEIVSLDSEYAGAVVPHSLAVIQQRAAEALQKVSNIMKVDIEAAESAVNDAGGINND